MKGTKDYRIISLEKRVTELELALSSFSRNNPDYSAVFCCHANENPRLCPCPDKCYCKTRTCKDKG